MGLTSKKVLILAVLIAVALFVLTIWLWPRLSKANWRTILGRIGLMLATQLSIFASIGLAANNAFGFYASWADLFGQEQQPGVVTNYETGPNGTKLKMLGTERVSVPGGHNPKVGGRIDRVLISGQHSKLASPAFVYLPPQYFQAKNTKRKFPASVVLTGYPGTAQALYKKLHFPQTQHKLVGQKKMQPTILVMLRPTVAPPRDTECVDVPNGPQAETFFVTDLRKNIASHYRVGTDAKNWGIIGDSTGGYCALKMTMRHPKAFSTAVALSGSYKAPLDATTGDLFGGSAKLERENDLMWRQKNLPAPPVNLLVTTSEQGESNYKQTLKFIRQTKSPSRISSIILDSGGHNFNTWRREIPAALEWMGGHLRA
ncbi:alpha/beta hydrolase-fold protein [Streptomyces sp. MST-110588]|uniref:alpha/beta hydrolase n=1 Tax=Streptomyces sp. MST-110588 TaxID=2833628 RepID=UPI001F5C6C9C|nr:alpha/beta hydrolase-fold protein [Streptomyces sp. MST-110588]UNO40623.1 prolyl oligopeptidase family serine peptidase [Streptomyces sp. MST-110588]